MAHILCLLVYVRTIRSTGSRVQLSWLAYLILLQLGVACYNLTRKIYIGRHGARTGEGDQQQRGWRGQARRQLRAVLGGTEVSQCHTLWTHVLLGLHYDVNTNTARVSIVQGSLPAAIGATIEEPLS